MLSSKPYIQTRKHESAATQVTAAKQATTDGLHKDTYRRLRWGMMIIAILFPFVLWFVALDVYSAYSIFFGELSGVCERAQTATSVPLEWSASFASET